MSYTDEQLKYINYNKKNHTKLLACAGSGKTRCIIARMNKLIESKKYEASSILMLTFSRFTRDDFMNKIKTYGGTCINVDSVKTIDKFAKQIIDPDGTVDVSLLSYRLMTYLEERSPSELKQESHLKQINSVFIDEAQDLNDIQNRIFCAMRDKLGIVINMIGDPNQNIYQFRNSSDKYLTEFEAVVFNLTKNFRSYLPIVNFSKHLRPFAEHDVICTKGDNNCKPIMMFYDEEKVLEDNIIDLLTEAQNNEIDMSEFAILSPTRGRMRGGGNSHGLCFISNILYRAGIKFKQFYEESTDEISGEGIKYEPVKGHVNVLTYMGSKGLEWNYVIIIDADACLINKRTFDADKHNYDRYLLYVACSRAVHNMYIFSKCMYRQGEYHFMTNPWFRNVPDNLYEIDERFSTRFFFPRLNYRTYSESDNRLAKLIDGLVCCDLDKVSNMLNFQKRVVKSQQKIFKFDYSSIEKLSAVFLSKYTEALFQALYNIKMNRKHVQFLEIEHIIEGENIVTGLSDEAADWYNQNKKSMTWAKFDASTMIPNLIKYAIGQAFDRNQAFNTHIIALNGYYNFFILDQKMWIKNLYKKYIKCKNTSQIREILFYLMVIKHSLDTQHYFHIKSKGAKYEHILTDYKNMFDEIEEYIDDIDHDFVASHKIVTRWEMISRVELLDDHDIVWAVKCTGEISLKHTLHSILSSLMYNTKLINENFTVANPKDEEFETKNKDKLISIDVNYINFMKGEEISYTYALSTATIKELIEMLHKYIAPAPDPVTLDVVTLDVVTLDVVTLDVVTLDVVAVTNVVNN